MLRYALLAGALAITTPAFAQDMTTEPTPEQAAPATTAPATPAPQEIAPAPAAPVTDPASPTTAQAQPAPQAAPAQPTSVAEVVKAEFPAYDKDSTGDLSKTEFSQWLIALRTKAEPSAAADKVALTAWAGKAFAQADKDKSASVTQTELTTFLSGAG